jgi:cobyrinic acid a,c-diamide synthase
MVMASRVDCPALLVAAPASGQGKTTMVAALARLHARQGRRVTVFKCGPDFLDPQIHAVASGRPCQNLDLGMCGESDARWRLARAAADSDLILIEGVMGLFDGQPSAADLAVLFGIPVLALIDARAMAQTFGAIAHGLANYQPGLPFAGVLANRVGSTRHAELLRDSLPAGIAWFGALPRTDDSLPERHLGLWQAAEVGDLAARLDLLADALAATTAVDLPPTVNFRHGAGTGRAATSGWSVYCRRPRYRLRFHLPGQPRNLAATRRSAALLLAAGRRAAAGLRRGLAAGRLPRTARADSGQEHRAMDCLASSR